jgi:hypothetical protein
MKKKMNLQDVLKEIQPLMKNEEGKLDGGFLPFGGDGSESLAAVAPTIITVGILVYGYACGCSCTC